MTTRAYVPNADGEGSIGTADKKWGAMYVTSPDSTASDDRVASTAWVQSIVADALAKQKTAYEQAISTAVTAAKTQAKLDAHPVGSYYWSNDSTSPATLFGGTWEALPAGYTLIAQGSGTDDFGSFNYVAGTKYGERMHKLTTDEMPNHSHTLNRNSNTGTESWCLIDHQSVTKWQTGNVGATGGNQPHGNIPPVIAAYGWKRTA
ncbi:phage baseplate protein [Acidaminococcus intestini]|uniref:phage baseplate protein n=1 Tax=Acidaminococcus intestini TaxID=187327 RepID=UPI003993CEDA